MSSSCQSITQPVFGRLEAERRRKDKNKQQKRKVLEAGGKPIRIDRKKGSLSCFLLVLIPDGRDATIEVFPLATRTVNGIFFGVKRRSSSSDMVRLFVRLFTVSKCSIFPRRKITVLDQFPARSRFPSRRNLSAINERTNRFRPGTIRKAPILSHGGPKDPWAVEECSGRRHRERRIRQAPGVNSCGSDLEAMATGPPSVDRRLGVWRC